MACEDKQPPNQSLTITGFGPFGGVEENPSTILVKELPGSLSCSSDTWKQQLANRIDQWIVLETSAKGVCETLDQIATADKPQILLHLGVNVNGTGYQMEQCAYNDASFRIPDQRGYQPQQIPIFDGRQVGERCNTTLNVEALVINQTKAFPKVETKLSTDPGRFVCNYLYCYSLNKLQSPQTQCLFLHIPSFEVVPKEVQLEYIPELMKQLLQLEVEAPNPSS